MLIFFPFVITPTTICLPCLQLACTDDSFKPFPLPSSHVVVGQAAEAGFSRDGDVPAAPPHEDLGAPRAGDGPLEGIHVAHDVQKLSQPPRRLGPTQVHHACKRQSVPSVFFFVKRVHTILSVASHRFVYFPFPTEECLSIMNTRGQVLVLNLIFRPVVVLYCLPRSWWRKAFFFSPTP